MREFIKSVVSFSLAVPLFAVKTLSKTLQSDETASDRDEKQDEASLDAVVQATGEQLDGTIKSVFKAGDKLQRDMVDRMFDSLPTDGSTAAVADQRTEEESTPEAVDPGQLDTATFVALGEGLAAGFGDFGLSAEYQSGSFAALVAGQMQTGFVQPLVEAPGIGVVPGFDDMPVIVPALMQNTALDAFPPPAVYGNLSVPGFRITDALDVRPCPPLVHRKDHKQTAANLILGGTDLMSGEGERSTQLESALRQSPTITLLELGYYEAVEAAIKVDPDQLPDVDAFRASYRPLLESLRKSGSQVLAMTIPDPRDTAYLSTVESAARNLKVNPSIIVEGYELNDGDRVTISGLIEMGCQLLSRNLAPLPDGAVVDAAVVDQVSQRVQALNAELASMAEELDVVVFDLHGFLHEVAEHGVTVGARRLSADFLGGIYQMNGHYPGLTGHALIANEVLELLNHHFSAAFPLVDIPATIEGDPVASYQQADGPDLELTDLSALSPAAPEEATASSDDVEFMPVEADPFEAPAEHHNGHASRLVLPDGLEQTLPLCKPSSYYGDAIRAVNCRTDEEGKFGSGRELLFGGVAMLDSHLNGHVHIKFSEPTDDVTHFEVSLGEGLVGDDGLMTAPYLFKLPAQQNSVSDDGDLISSGDLNLATGEVTNLDFAFRFFNTALLALVRCNPKFPDVPIQFPGMYGSASAHFEQRPDGKLDFTFQGTTFIPLGMALEDPIRFPLPFCSPALEYASIPGHGTTLHPHIQLSTRPPMAVVDESKLPEIPENEIREYTIHAHNTSFGDKFHLTAPELVGDPTGRSQLMGRVQVQFGQRFGDSVSVAISHLNPGGLLTPDPGSPLGDDFPGRLPPAPIGHNEFLRFSQRTYYLDSLTCIDDPFDFCVGAVNVKTGNVLGEMLHRALIGQNVFYALVRLEPRTPKESFMFQGPARFEKDGHGQTVLRFRGQVTIPYPEGNLFPAPDLATTFTAGPDSVLDPFLWVQAMDTPEAPEAVMKGEAELLVSSASEVFSYHFEIPGSPDQHAPVFEYTNHTQGGHFRLDSLSWVSFTNSRESKLKPGKHDTVTFSGFGVWDKNDVQTDGVLVNVQVSTAPKGEYVSIQIGAAVISNVNTKPEDIDEVRP